MCSCVCVRAGRLISPPSVRPRVATCAAPAPRACHVCRFVCGDLISRRRVWYWVVGVWVVCLVGVSFAPPWFPLSPSRLPLTRQRLPCRYPRAHAHRAARVAPSRFLYPPFQSHAHSCAPLRRNLSRRTLRRIPICYARLGALSLPHLFACSRARSSPPRPRARAHAHHPSPGPHRPHLIP